MKKIKIQIDSSILNILSPFLIFLTIAFSKASSTAQITGIIGILVIQIFIQTLETVFENRTLKREQTFEIETLKMENKFLKSELDELTR